jgi:hypothetical protein
MKMTTLTKTTLPFAAVALLAATSQAATTSFDHFSTDPNIGSEWTEYSYYKTENVTPTWNSTTNDLDVVHTAGGAGNGVGLYRTGTTRSTTDAVTLTVNSLSRSSGSWGYVGLMIAAEALNGYVTTNGDSYSVLLASVGGTNVQHQVRRTYLDGTSNFILYTGTTFDLATNGPVNFDIERNGDHYDFLADGALLYSTAAPATGDNYDLAARDSLVNYQIVTAGDGSITANVNNFGVAPVPEPSTTALLGLGGLALILRRRR